MNIKQIIKECLNKNSIKIQELVNEELDSKAKKLIEDYTPSVSSRLFENDTNHDEIMKKLNSDDIEDRIEAVMTPNLTSEHLDKALNDPDEWIRITALSHPNIQQKHINKALKDKSYDMVKTAKYLNSKLKEDYKRSVSHRL